MKKLYGVVTLTVGLAVAPLLSRTTTRVEAAAAPAGITNVVLVHGAFADGSGWEAVMKILEKDIEMLPKSRNFRKSKPLARVNMRIVNDLHLDRRVPA